MRKRVISDGPQQAPPADHEWLELPALAAVEVTSEDAAHPVEAALGGDPGGGWRAAQPGEQALRVLFDEPQRLSRIFLLFEEEEGRARTQEFVLRWSGDGGRTYREVVRQQYNFSPPGTAREAEDYRVELDGVTALELRITPDVGGGDSRASLKQLRLASRGHVTE